MTEGQESSGPVTIGAGVNCSQKASYPRSPPKSEVDESPLGKYMDKNKEKLEVKLLLRRPINQLVAQGIMPLLKTSPTIYDQLLKLEKAKMGDLLNTKIQQRPDREELVRQHILESDVANVDPSLAQRQRMLKKCQLADALNDQLSNRPGPLELIKKNILHTEEPIERAVKEGQIEFKATSEGQRIKLEPPDQYITMDDDSPSSNAQFSQVVNLDFNTQSSQHVPSSITEPVLVKSTGENATLFNIDSVTSESDVVSVVMTPAPGILSTGSNPSSLGSYSEAVTSSVACNNIPAFSSSALIKQPQTSPGKDKSRRKSKSKCQQPKSRTIKFHEYKGPPNISKPSTPPSSNSNVLTNSETSYDLLLQQQQLFLQWQLDSKQKYPQVPLTITDPSAVTQSISSLAVDQPFIPSPADSPPLPVGSVPSSSHANEVKPLRNLEEMKVSDLKVELKKRNLRVSGAKTHLIQRLKPYAECNPNSRHRPISFFIPLHDDPTPDSNLPSPMSQISQMAVVDKIESLSKPNSPQTAHETYVVISSKDKNAINSEDAKIKGQQNRIEELQRELLNSQLLLQHRHQLQQKVKQQTLQFQRTVNSMGLFKPQLQNHRSQSVPSVAMPSGTNVNWSDDDINVVKNINNHNNTNNNNKIVDSDDDLGKGRQRSNTVILGEHPATLVQNQLQKVNRQQQRTTSLPNFVGTFMQPQTVFSGQLESIVPIESPKLLNYLYENTHNSSPENKQDYMSDDKITLSTSKDVNMTNRQDFQQDEEISRLFKENLSSGNVIDVLALLIKNGEFDPTKTKSVSKYEEILLAEPMDQSNELVTQVHTQADGKINPLSNISIDSNVPSQHLSLEELGIEMDTFPMDVNEHQQSMESINNAEIMNVDSDWLDRLICSGITSPEMNAEWSKNVTDPFDLFILNDNDFKIGTECSWDRADFSA